MLQVRLRQLAFRPPPDYLKHEAGLGEGEEGGLSTHYQYFDPQRHTRDGSTARWVERLVPIISPLATFSSYTLHINAHIVHLNADFSANDHI